MIGIYKITSPKNKVYIGQSVDIEKRFREHKNMGKNDCKKLYNSFRKYGVENHKFEVIHKCQIDELNKEERYYQEHYCATSDLGLNLILTRTDSLRAVFSDESRLKISQANKGRKYSPESRLKLSIAKKNISDETRSKMSIAQKGRKVSEVTRLKLKNREVSEKTREKIRISQKEISNRGIFRGYMKGIKHTEEAKKKISLSHKGKIVSEETRLKMSISKKDIDKKKGFISKEERKKIPKKKTCGLRQGCCKKVIDNQTGIIYDSTVDAAKSFGLNKIFLRKCLNKHFDNSLTYL